MSDLDTAILLRARRENHALRQWQAASRQYGVGSPEEQAFWQAYRDANGALEYLKEAKRRGATVKVVVA